MKIYLIAGEPSGDFLGGQLMAALKAQSLHQIEFSGIGSARMQEQGISSLFPMEDLTAMGLAEVLPRIPHFMRRIDETVNHIKTVKPDILITIDAPDFCFRVVKALKKNLTPHASRPMPYCIHYVAPTVWAWREKRAEKVAKLYDQLLCLFPFEPPYFTPYGLKADFAGHPIISSKAGDGDEQRFRLNHNISGAEKILCVLPGSRKSEVRRLLPVFIETVQRLQQQFAFQWAIPTVPNTYELVKSIIDDYAAKSDQARAEVSGQSKEEKKFIPPVILQTEDDKFDCYAASHAALAASGSVALELAKARLPAVIGYKFGWLTSQILPHMMKIKYANLVNILLDRAAIPEFLLGDCTADNLTAAISKLLSDSDAVQDQKTAYWQAITMLWPASNRLPAMEAANCVLQQSAAH